VRDLHRFVAGADLYGGWPLRAALAATGLFAARLLPGLPTSPGCSCRTWAAPKRLLGAPPIGADGQDGARGFLRGCGRRRRGRGPPPPQGHLAGAGRPGDPSGIRHSVQLRDRWLQEVCDRLRLDVGGLEVEIASDKDCGAGRATARTTMTHAPGFAFEKASREIVFAGTQGSRLRHAAAEQWARPDGGRAGL